MERKNINRSSERKEGGKESKKKTEVYSWGHMIRTALRMRKNTAY
jgi:hypothetical protein